MIVFVSVDDKFGIMFNNRRLSRDRVLCEKVAELSEGNLWMSTYSEELFKLENLNIKADDDYLNKAVSGDYCFVERDSLEAHEEKIEKLVLFKWNRHYPSDVKLGIDLKKWVIKSSLDFIGSSHEKITMEEYERV